MPPSSPSSPTRNQRSSRQFVDVGKVLTMALHPRPFRTIIKALGRYLDLKAGQSDARREL